MRKKILVIGSGGREHALVWKLAQSVEVGEIFVAPGNGGTASIATNVPINVTDVAGLLRFARDLEIDLTVVPQENALAAGIVDVFTQEGLRIFGPTKLATEIESSKVFSKDLMMNALVNTANYTVYNRHEYDRALSYVRLHGVPVVIKASGLALGKGAYVCKTTEAAEKVLQEIMIEQVHGDAGDQVIIEDFVEGLEISIHTFCSGRGFVMFPSSQDNKPAFDGDKGPNTGGMGTIAPVPWFTPTMMQEAIRIVNATLEKMMFLARPFVGCLYPGLKATNDGLSVLEFNARPGDPETQVYMRLLKTDLLEMIEACIDGQLHSIGVKWYSGFAVCIVLASGGYPGIYRKGFPIYGIKDAESDSRVVVFHAGTAKVGNQLVTSGGRVLGVTATGLTLEGALQTAYQAAEKIHFKGMQYRKDIGQRSLALAREKGMTT